MLLLQYMIKEIKKEEKPKKKKPSASAKESKDFGVTPEKMAEAGLHFGHRASRVHPKMKPFISCIKNDVHIIDLEASAEKFKKCLEFIQKLVSDDKTLLLVGTKIQIKELVKDIALSCDLPYINERWLGGTFTNFETIKKRVDYFKDLEKKKEWVGTKQIDYEYYHKKSKPIIDEIDKVLAQHYGFTDEELDFIINYDIKYRMGKDWLKR